MDKMICNNCGKEVDRTDAFCRYCGTNLTEQLKIENEQLEQNLTKDITLLKELFKGVDDRSLNKEFKNIFYLTKIIELCINTESVDVKNIATYMRISDDMAQLFVNVMLKTGYIKQENDNYVINCTEDDVEELRGLLYHVNFNGFEFVLNHKRNDFEYPNINDEYVLRSIKLFMTTNSPSITAIQREFEMGFPRAASIFNRIVNMGFVTDSRPHKLNITVEKFIELCKEAGVDPKDL